MKCIVIGAGRTGSGLAHALSRDGHTVTVIDNNPYAVERLGASFKGRTVVGNGLDRQALLEAGIERTDGLAAVTGSDEANVVIARLARELFQVPRVVAGLHDPLKAEVYRRLGLQVVSQIEWGIRRMAALLGYSQLDTVLSLGSGEVEIVEAEIPSLLVGRPMSYLAVPGEIRVVAVRRKGRTFIPTPEAAFRKGDTAWVAVLSTSMGRLRSLLELT